MDLPTCVKVSTLQWIRRLLKNPNSNTAISLSHFLGTKDLSYKRLNVPKGVAKIKFYVTMFNLWNSFHSIEPFNEDELREEILWENHFITHKGSPLKWFNWENSGIITIQHLFHPSESRFYSHTEIAEVYGVNCTFLDALSLRLSITLRWRQLLTQEGNPTQNLPSTPVIFIHLPGEEKSDILIASAKAMYTSFISNNGHTSTAYSRWSNRDDELQIVNLDEWADVNRRIYESTRETKLQALQYKIINRIIICNQYLKQLRIKQTENCPSCNQTETISHFLLDCPLLSATGCRELKIYPYNIFLEKSSS